MSLRSALVDTATVVRREPAGRVVEGRTIREAVEGASFRCRLDFESMEDQPEAVIGVPSVIRSATLLFAVKDETGVAISVSAADRLRITSKSLANLDELFDVAGDPQPIRKKRRLIGWTVQVRHVTVPEAAS